MKQLNSTNKVLSFVMFTKAFSGALKSRSRNLRLIRPLNIHLRYESSSSSPPQPATLGKKKLTLLEQQQKQQKEKEEKLKADEQAQSRTSTEGNSSNKSESNSIQKKIIKEGFSNIIKVPDTDHILPQDILLDKLFQGYGPLTVPIQPQKFRKKSRTVLCVELDQGDDPFDAQYQEDYDEGYRSPFAFSLKGESPRFEISDHSFNEEETIPDDFESDIDNDPEETEELSLLDKYFKASKRSHGRKRFVFSMSKPDKEDEES